MDDPATSSLTCIHGSPAPVASGADPLAYRHFAVDEAADVVYFCDPDPVDPGRGNRCFSKQSQGTVQGEEQLSITKNDNL